MDFVKRSSLMKGYVSIFILFFIMVSTISVNAQSWQMAYNNALNAYSTRFYNKAIEEGEKALTLAVSTNEKLFTLKILSATSYELGDHKNGVGYAKQEINLCVSESVPDSVYINSLNNLINNYLGLEEFENAKQYQKKLVLLGKSFYNPDDLKYNQHISDLGYSLLMTNEFDSAIYHLSVANKYLININGGAEDFLLNQLNIGQAYNQKNSFITALGVLQGLVDILESNQLERYQIYAETMESLALVQFNIGNLKASQEAYVIASKKYSQLGYSTKNLKALNEQLSLVYLKNEETLKFDSIQSLYSNKVSSQNLLINQLSLAYKKYAAGDFSGSKQILNQVFFQLTESEPDKKLLAEAILLNTRLNLELYGNSDKDSIDLSIAIFSKLNLKNKEAEGYFLKAKTDFKLGLSDKGIANLNTANKLCEALSENLYLKYNISLELLSIYLQLKDLKKANNLYQQTISTNLLTGSEYENKLAYGYSIFLQINGYNLEALDILEPLIKNAQYPDLLNYQQLVAKVYIDLGQANKSFDIYNRIDNYLNESGNSTSIEYGENLVQLGRVNVVLGDFAKAEKFYIKGINLLENKPTTPSRIFASTYNSFAIYQQTIGNYEKAKFYYSKAKPFASDNISLQVDIIQNLATLSQHEGDYYEAIILLKEAVDAYAAIYSKNHPYYATALQNLANAYNKNGDPAKAIELLDEAIRIDKNNGLENNISNTNKLHNLAVILLETDELNRAKEIFTTVLANRSRLLGENHPDYIYSLYNMAVLMQKMNNYSQAKEYFKRVIEKYDFQIESFFPYLSEQEKSKYYSKIKEAFTAFQDFAAEYSSIDQSINIDLYNFQLNHKAILLNSSKSINKIIDQSDDIELISTYNNWIELKTSLAKYYSMSKKELELAGISIGAILNEANNLEKKISLKTDLLSSNHSVKQNNWKDVQSKLNEDEAAIEIIRIKKNTSNDIVWYAAVIVKPELSVPKLIVLDNGMDLESKFFKLYINSIKFKRQDTQSYNNFWKPIDEALVGVKKIFLSSDGIYNKINISSLFNPTPETYVLDQMIVHNVTNTIEVTSNMQPITINDEFNITLLGDPSFDGDGKQDYSITPLPGTRIEVETIDSLTQIKGIESVKLLGNSASEENLKSIESTNILHIATHGFFLADNDPNEDMYSIENNPLMRSGLLLFGSAKSFRGDHIGFSGSSELEDGILTAYETMNMRLTKTDLVILSACETGLGEVKNGEGVYGLQRAFIIAGAKSIIISLWKVDDTSTKELMILFYQNIFNGMDKFEALNIAQKQLKEKYSLPYYWGAFVISGI